MIRSLSVMAMLCLFLASASAQKFDVPMVTCSGKKVSYLTLTDGTQVEGLMKDLGFKKGLIAKMKFEPVDGSKVKLKPASIKHMYLPPSGIEKLGKTLEFAHDAQMWKSRDVDQEIINKGYVYYEQTDVLIKKKKMKLMMQLLNSSFSDGIKIYNDPFANETTSVGVAGITVAGGDAKSYYIKKGNGTAYRLYKKNYDKEFPKVFSDCPKLKSDPTAGKWSSIEAHVHTYATECAK